LKTHANLFELIKFPCLSLMTMHNISNRHISEYWPIENLYHK